MTNVLLEDPIIGQASVTQTEKDREEVTSTFKVVLIDS